MRKTFGKSASIIFALLVASLVLSGVGIWKLADPVNKVWNGTIPHLKQDLSEGNLINKSEGNGMVGLGVLFTIFSVVSLYVSRH